MPEQTQGEEKNGDRGLIESPWQLVRGALDFVVAIAIALGTWVGSRFSESVQRNLLVFVLSAALLFTVYLLCAIVYRSRSARTTRAGIVNAWARRSELNRHHVLAYLEKASSIDLLGFNMRNFWLAKDSPFDLMLRARLQWDRKLRVRVLIADPEHRSLEVREVIEDSAPSGRLRAETRTALMNLCDILNKFPDCGLEVRLLEAERILSSMIFVEDRVFVTSYLCTTGNNCPTLEIRSGHQGQYNVYREEFERLWNHAAVYKAA